MERGDPGVTPALGQNEPLLRGSARLRGGAGECGDERLRVQRDRAPERVAGLLDLQRRLLGMGSRAGPVA